MERVLFSTNTKNVSLFFRRFYNMKKLEIWRKNNPQLSQIFEEQKQKNKARGTLDRLIEKRTTEYKEYFHKSSEPSVIHRVKPVSYDHIGKKRALHLTKILRSFINERIGSGEIGDTLSTKNFQITNIFVPVDLNRIEILWWSPEDEIKTIEELLHRGAEELSAAIRIGRILPHLPRIVFRRDQSTGEREKIEKLIDTADKGEFDQTKIEKTPEQRDDLYDGDRTVLLKKLEQRSTSIDEPIEENENMTVEQIQRRMKAFALTKKLKRFEKERSAIDGILAIERERLNAEKFDN